MQTVVGQGWIRSAVAVILLASAVKAAAQPAAPEISYFGVIKADDSLLEPSETLPDGTPVFVRPIGFGFSVVVETAAQGNFTSYEPGGCPNLELQVDRPLGDGGAAVCEELPPGGGVPAVNPPILTGEGPGCDVANDLGCRFQDGAGGFESRTCNDSCVLFPDGGYDCVAPEQSRRQFCGRIARAWDFPVGDTRVTARIRDGNGISDPAQIVVRILPPPPTLTPTATPEVNTADQEDDSCAIRPARGGASTVGEILFGLVALIGLRRRTRR